MYVCMYTCSYTYEASTRLKNKVLPWDHFFQGCDGTRRISGSQLNPF